MHDMYISLICCSVGGIVKYIDEPTINYRQHQNNVVGVDVSLIQKIKNRFIYPFKPQTVSIADQANEVLEKYGDYIDFKEKNELRRVVEYRKTLISRLLLACTLKIHYLSFSIGFRNRLAILLGNK